MRYLLDTHILLWVLADSPKLPTPVRQLVERSETDLYVSSVSAWEMYVKKAQGRLEAPDDLGRVVAETKLQELPLTISHAMRVGTLPTHHRDPFDRMLIAQAQVEEMVLVTVDRNIALYDVALAPALGTFTA